MPRNLLRKWKWFVANQRTRKEEPLHGLPDASLRLELWVLGDRGALEDAAVGYAPAPLSFRACSAPSGSLGFKPRRGPPLR